jgi:UDP-N-acetylmuramate dehydrogenase
VTYLPSGLRQILKEMRRGESIEVYERVDLRAWTGLGVGGYGDLLIRCSTTSSVQDTVDLLAAYGTGWLVIGAGSRVVPPDRGFRVPMINLTGDLGRWTVGENSAEAGAGAKLAHVSGAVARAELLGMDNLTRAPGSVGGAVLSAAARQTTERFSRIVEWVEVVRPGTGASRHPVAQTSASGWPRLPWRRSVITKVRFGLTAADQRQPRRPRPRAPWTVGGARLGSLAFHDPPGETASDVLERAGCATLRVGGARVSDRDANLIQATRVCSAQDVIQLCRDLIERVRDHSGVALEPRLCFLDERGRPLELES